MYVDGVREVADGSMDFLRRNMLEFFTRPPLYSNTPHDYGGLRASVDPNLGCHY